MKFTPNLLQCSIVSNVCYEVISEINLTWNYQCYNEICSLEVSPYWKNWVILMIIVHPLQLRTCQGLWKFQLIFTLFAELGHKKFPTQCSLEECHQCKSSSTATILTHIFLLNWKHLAWRFQVMEITYAELKA